MTKVSFDPASTGFFKALKERTDRYFVENGIHSAGNRKLYIKSGIQVMSAIAIYVVLVFFTPPVPVAVLLCALFGFNLAVIGFNVMHEGGHQSFSRYAWLNRVSAYSLNMLGGTSFFWKVKHNINHHTYTNIEGLDHDIDVKPFMRLHEGQPRRPYHRFQHIYWVLLYGISYIAWVFYKDFLEYFTKRITAHIAPRRWPAREHVIFWLTKVLYVGMYIVLPVLLVGWLNALVGFTIAAFVCGMTTSVVFQLAHAVEGTAFPSPEKDSRRIAREWALHQMSSTANFATRNKMFFWLLGGLNFQIEHHLFPRISHIHYPQISRFVRETCKEFNVAYHEHSSMFKALVSHVVFLKRLGMTGAR